LSWRILDELGRLAQIQNMNVQELKKRLSGGFRPFAIRTTDGQEFVIPHPEFLLIGKYSIAVRDKEGFINTLDPLHVVASPPAKMTWQRDNEPVIRMQRPRAN